MLKFRFTPIEGATVIERLTPGHITIRNDEVEHSSSSTAQPMFLLYAIHDLLFGVFHFMKNTSDKQYIFESPYGDYKIKLTRKHNQVTSVFVLCRGTHLISQTSPEQLRIALWQGVEEMRSKYAVLPVEREDDFTHSVEYRQEFHVLQQRWVATFPELYPIVFPR